MSEQPRHRRFQFDLPTLFWLTFVVAAICVLLPGLFGFWSWLDLGRGFKQRELNGPIILACVAFLAVRGLIRRDRP